MPDERIEVISYSGYRDEETPTSFMLGGEKIEVVEIIRRWIEEGVNDRRRKRVFKVKGHDGFIYTLFRDEGTGEWFMAGHRA
jgi:hypothetical protein